MFIHTYVHIFMRLYESPQDNLNSWRKLCPKPAKSKGEPERRKTASVARKKIDAGLLSNLTKKMRNML